MNKKALGITAMILAGAFLVPHLLGKLIHEYILVRYSIPIFPPTDYIPSWVIGFMMLSCMFMIYALIYVVYIHVHAHLETKEEVRKWMNN